MTVLNARSVDAAQPRAARYELSDPLLRALRLIVQPSGVKSWAVRVTIAGKKAKLTLGGYPALILADAREVAREALQAVARGEDPRIARRDADAPSASLASAVALYDRLYVSTLRPATQANVRRELGIAADAWGDRPLASIVRKDVIVLADLAAVRGPSACNSLIKNLSAFFGWCEARDLITSSPARGVRRTREVSRDRVLDDAELAKVWHAAETAGGAVCALTKLLILTGARRSEIAHLEWSEITATSSAPKKVHHVTMKQRMKWTAARPQEQQQATDDEAIVLPPERTKTGVAHRIAITPAMRAVLDALPRTPGRKYVVNNSNSPWFVDGAAKDQLDGAGIAPWTFHDLRRSFASGCARIGIMPHVIERCLNHTIGGVAGIYQRHTYEAECKSAWEAWSKHIEEIVGGKL